MTSKTTLLSLLAILFWALSSCTTGDTTPNQYIISSPATTPTPLTVDESLLSTTKRPFFLQQLSPEEGKVIPLALFEAHNQPAGLEVIAAWGEDRDHIGYNSEICIELDVAHLGYANDTYVTLPDLEERLELRLNGIPLTEITSFNSAAILEIAEFNEGKFTYSGPFVICWKIDPQVQAGVQKSQFIFYTSKNETFSYEWQFRITENP